MNQALRQRLLQQRQQLSPDQVQHASHAIISQILTMPLYQQSTHVCLYRAAGGEIDLSELFDRAVQAGKTCYFPVISDYNHHLMQFYAVDKNSQWVENRYGILEPNPDVCQLLDANQDVCVCVPLVGFRADCHRLGMGGGYYDRWLAAHKTAIYAIGLAFDWQFCEHFGINEWDQALSMVQTPTRRHTRAED